MCALCALCAPCARGRREHLFIVCELLRDNLYELYKYFKAHVHDGAHALATMTSPLAGGRLGEAAVAPPGGVGGVSAGVGGLPRYFTVPRVLSVARQVLTALAFVHSHCLVHCDLKVTTRDATRRITRSWVACVARCDAVCVTLSRCWLCDEVL